MRQRKLHTVDHSTMTQNQQGYESKNWQPCQMLRKDMESGVSSINCSELYQEEEANKLICSWLLLCLRPTVICRAGLNLKAGNAT